MTSGGSTVVGGCCGSLTAADGPGSPVGVDVRAGRAQSGGDGVDELSIGVLERPDRLVLQLTGDVGEVQAQRLEFTGNCLRVALAGAVQRPGCGLPSQRPAGWRAASC